MIEALLVLVVGLLLTAAIIAANGYFVAQEFAYMSVDRARLRAAADTGDQAAHRALAITRRTSFMLSGAQLGITVTGLLAGYVAEPFIGESIGTLLGGAGLSPVVGVAIGTVLALVIATGVQMVFGELFPKNLAIARPERLAKALARSTRIYLTAFGWLIALFDHAANAVLRLLRVEPVHDLDSSATAEDLEHIIDDSRQSGDLPEELSLLLDRVLDFPAQDVEHAMTPRARVDLLPAATSIAEARARMAEQHTRYPVVGDHDEPLGVVHLLDVLRVAEDDARPVTAIMRPPVVLPTLMRLSEAFDALSRSRDELACVIDEYGGFAGVLTVEDLAEELVGEIGDEHDPDDESDPELVADGVWTMPGELHLDEVERAIGRDLPPRDDFETLAGLVIAERGSLPSVGDAVEVALPATGAELIEEDLPPRALRLEVLEVTRHVPSALRVELVERRFEDEVAADEDGPIGAHR
ncbi:hemolysin family protein [Amnibacterium endophyticum]|uniref:Hemolysin family protein n=1 Tax=Amnibacterium endophyticum TaxID=2109337 RepID=A0ABW4LFC3_9MICO